MRTQILLACILVAVLPACGGGGEAGGADPLSPKRVAGEYHVVRIFGVSALQVTRVAVGTVTLDEAGGASFVNDINRDGVISLAEAFAWTFDISEDETLRLTTEGGDTLRGFASADRKELIFGSEGGLPQMIVLVRQQASISPSVLEEDTYRFGFLRDVLGGPGGYLAYDGSTDFNDAGDYFERALPVINYLGTLDTDMAALGTYSVAATGRLEVVRNNSTLRGLVSADGDYGLLGGGFTAGRSPFLGFYVRESSSAAVATPIGRYVLGAFGHFDGVLASLSGTLSFDGSGTAVFSGVYREGGGTHELNELLMQVTADASGNLELLSEAGRFLGQLTPDGRFAALSGSYEASNKQGIMILARQ